MVDILHILMAEFAYVKFAALFIFIIMNDNKQFVAEIWTS